MNRMIHGHSMRWMGRPLNRAAKQARASRRVFSMGIVIACGVAGAAQAAPVLDAVRQIAPNAVEVDWSDATPAGSVLYNVERSSSASGPWTRLIADLDRDDTRRYTDADVPTVWGAYYYRIASKYDALPPEQVSNVVSVVLDPACEGFCIARGMDRDADGTLDVDDNCVALANDQTDTDGDGVGDACDAPADYSGFISVIAEDEADLLAKITATPDQTTHIYIPPRVYTLPATIEIKRTAPLVIHGAGRNQTKITAASGVSPVFRILDADTNPAGTHIQFSNFRIQNPNNTTREAHFIGVSLETTLSGHLDLTEVYFENTGVVIEGPGFVRLQAAVIAGRTAVQESLLIDHPDADVFTIGGGLGGGGNPPVAGIVLSEVSHLRLKAGRIRSYTSSNAGARGKTDYWIEAGSKFGPHVLADVRSEGANASNFDCTDPGPSANLTSKLLFVPPTDERVDVIIKGTLASWSSKRQSCPHTAGDWDLVSYSSPGRLWLVHNLGGLSYETLVSGTSPGAHVISTNNQSFEPVLNKVDVGGTGRMISVGDLGSWHYHCQIANGHSGLGQPPCNTGSRYRYYLPDGSGGYAADYDPLYDPADPSATPPDRFETLGVGVVPFPKDVIPPPMSRPRLTAALPGMIDVTDPTYGAVGDGVANDGPALQAALSVHGSGVGTDNSALVYFPAGTYCVQDTLYWNHQLNTTGEAYLSSSMVPGVVKKGNNNGWWAGAGSDQTTIRFDSDCDGTPDPGNVLETQKMVLMTVQGMTFETAADNGIDDTKAFWVENFHQQCSDDPMSSLPVVCAVTPPPVYQPARYKYELPDPFGMGATFGSTFDDVVFRGGRHAHAMAIETHANNSEVLWTRSSFTDAERGLTLANANALNNIVYDVEFLRNDEMMGPGGGGDFSIFGATTDGGLCPDHIGTNLYIYGLDDSGGTGCSSYLQALGVSYNVHVGRLYENSILAPAAGAVQIDRERSGHTTFLHSTIMGPVSVDLHNSHTTMDSIVSLHSTHPPWNLQSALDETAFESALAIFTPEPTLATGLVAGVVGLLGLTRRPANGTGSRSRA